MTVIIEENRYLSSRDSRTVAVTSRPFELAQWEKPGNERKGHVSLTSFFSLKFGREFMVTESFNIAGQNGCI